MTAKPRGPCFPRPFVRAQLDRAAVARITQITGTTEQGHALSRLARRTWVSLDQTWLFLAEPGDQVKTPDR